MRPTVQKSAIHIITIIISITAAVPQASTGQHAAGSLTLSFTPGQQVKAKIPEERRSMKSAGGI